MNTVAYCAKVTNADCGGLGKSSEGEGEILAIYRQSVFPIGEEIIGGEYVFVASEYFLAINSGNEILAVIIRQIVIPFKGCGNRAYENILNHTFTPKIVSLWHMGFPTLPIVFRFAMGESSTNRSF